MRRFIQRPTRERAKSVHCSQRLRRATGIKQVLKGPRRQIRLKGRTGEELEAYIALAYFPDDTATGPPPPYPLEMEELVQYCQKRRTLLLLGCDANAHHLVWGSSDTLAWGQLGLKQESSRVTKRNA